MLITHEHHFWSLEDHWHANWDSNDRQASDHADREPEHPEPPTDQEEINPLANASHDWITHPCLLNH